MPTAANYEHWLHQLSQRYQPGDTPPNLCYHLIIDEQHFTLQLTDQCQWLAGEPPKADCTIAASSSTFKALFTGKRSAMQAVMTGQLIIKGSIGQAMAFKSYFAANE